MADLSKQEINNLIKQTESTILSRTASKQDILEAIQCLCARLSTKQDLVMVSDKLKDSKSNKLLLSVIEEHTALRQLVQGIDAIKLRLDRIESRLADIDVALEKIKILNNQINNHTRLREIPLKGKVTS